MLAQYSSLDRTRDIYAVSLRPVGQYFKFRLRTPRVELALLEIISM